MKRAEGQIAIYSGLLAVPALRLHFPNEGLFYCAIKKEEPPIEGEAEEEGGPDSRGK